MAEWIRGEYTISSLGQPRGSEQQNNSPAGSTSTTSLSPKLPKSSLSTTSEVFQRPTKSN